MPQADRITQRNGPPVLQISVALHRELVVKMARFRKCYLDF